MEALLYFGTPPCFLLEKNGENPVVAQSPIVL